MTKIDTYNKAAQAVIFTIIVLILVGFALSAFLSPFFWKRGVQDRMKTQMSEADQKKHKLITIGSPLVTKYSDYVMVPIGQALVPRSQLKEDVLRAFYSGGIQSFSLSNYESNYYRYGLGSGDYNNILFYKKDGSGAHLLLDRKAAISDLYYPHDVQRYGSETEPPPVRYLLFGIVDADYNGDGFLTPKDAVAAYVADLDGRNLKRISPPNTQLLAWNFDAENGLAYISYVEDTNKDRFFNLKDQTSMVVVDLATGAIKHSVVDQKLIDKVKSIVF